MNRLLPLLLLCNGCDAFFRGMEEERARIEAAKRAPPPEPPAPSDLSAEPTRPEVMDWLAKHDIASVRDDALHARWGAVTDVDPADLARAWSTLDRASASDPDHALATVLAAVAFTGGGAYPPGPRRTFLELTALRTPSILETRASEPLRGLIPWISELNAVSPADAMVAYLEVMKPGEIDQFLMNAQIVDNEDGEWDIDDTRLRPLPDAVLDAIEAGLHAGIAGPRSQVVRGIERERARRGH